jgi:hypothetical protein
MAVYSVPRLHEDDAVRAVRGAAERAGALDTLNVDLEAEWGVRLALRTGVNTGEVVVGDDAIAWRTCRQRRRGMRRAVHSAQSDERDAEDSTVV